MRGAVQIKFARPNAHDHLAKIFPCRLVILLAGSILAMARRTLILAMQFNMFKYVHCLGNLSRC